MKKLLVLTVVLFFAFTAASFAKVVTVKNSTDLKSAPSMAAESTTLVTLDANTKVTETGKTQADTEGKTWAEITTSDGKTGWIPSDMIEKGKALGQKKHVAKATKKAAKAKEEVKQTAPAAPAAPAVPATPSEQTKEGEQAPAGK
jgi:uncharacterized protein YgiM (DUF1202 family)